MTSGRKKSGVSSRKPLKVKEISRSWFSTLVKMYAFDLQTRVLAKRFRIIGSQIILEMY
jgi:hypothetical protein